MPKFVVEREIAGAGKWTAEQKRAVAQKSNGVLKELGPYVTDDKVYCVYIAPSEQLIREHAAKGGFPVNRVSEIRGAIDPTSAER